MLNKIFSVFDVKAEIYMNPFTAGSSGLAIRTFTDIANDTSHPIGQHPEDYTLFELGTWDPVTCEIKQHEAKIPLGSANDYIQPQYADPKIGDLTKVS